MVPKSPHEMEKAESWYGRQQSNRPAATGWWLPLRPLPWRPAVLPRGTLPVHRPRALRAVLPPPRSQPSSLPWKFRTLSHVIVAATGVPRPEGR